MTFIVEIDWAENLVGEEFSGFFGPFESSEDAYAWGKSEIRNGEWSVFEPQAPRRTLRAPFHTDPSLPARCSEECDWCGENMPRTAGPSRHLST